MDVESPSTAVTYKATSGQKRWRSRLLAPMVPEFGEIDLMDTRSIVNKQGRFNNHVSDSRAVLEKKTSDSLRKHENPILCLANMRYTIEEALAAIDRCGKGQSELTVQLAHVSRPRKRRLQRCSRHGRRRGWVGPCSKRVHTGMFASNIVSTSNSAFQDADRRQYHKDSPNALHTKTLRFLNKACIIQLRFSPPQEAKRYLWDCVQEATSIIMNRGKNTLLLQEVHYNQHGLLLLEGQGIYHLGDSGYPVEAGDAIWMAPFVPQWYAVLGKIPTRCLLYKNVNRNPL
ncbi:hypothetical protein M8C21_033516 [Ambrosia artemisiifolia]|uniref:(S)-ureidoglycine aminohydrolase cupin domain-containing protein n=1 Tax=Ambrosia artemisiifolia TaxID=4212 RepID=A0AAD5GGC2_AMBAR|nr:hypothetical protein M8C21_033516 [Ambrosia artemisiifolia]